MTELIKRDDALAAMNSHDWQKTYFAICALPAINPAAIREAALREAASFFEEGSNIAQTILDLIGETK